MTENVQTGMATVAGADLSYELAGAGPALVLVHANPANRTMWDDQMGVLRARYRDVRYDQRGFGGSTPAAGPFSHHEDLNGLLDVLGIERAHVVGLSNGSLVATDFALSYPKRVRSLVLASPALGGYTFSSEPPQTLVALWAALGQGDLDAAAELAARVWADGPTRSPEEVDPGFRQRFKSMARNELDAMLPDAVPPRGLEPPAIDRLGTVGVPTCIVLGDQDDPSIAEIGTTLQAGIGGAEAVVVAGAAHMLNMEEPEAFNRAVLGFLARQQAVA